MTGMYHEGNRDLQARFDTTRLADRLEELIVHDAFDDNDRGFIESVDMFFLATADAAGAPTVSYKGGDPGFVRVVEPSVVAFPVYDGNGMFLSFGNVLANPEVGLLFIDFLHPRRLRVQGTASLHDVAELLARWPEAKLVVQVRARQVFQNCPRYIHRFEEVERSAFVPRPGLPTPIPDWKRYPPLNEVLPPTDPAKA
jgi:predicted pyridoxine 5'-phosphate oxidase superfamily flavin-nucleotide-binding protein